jgi:uncharacterized integral membrane protein (TIGR00698 family)
MLQRGLFILALVACCLPWCTPPVALAVGLAFGLSGSNPWPCQSSRYSKLLLKLSVIGLGFGMDLGTVVHTGRSTFAYTCIGIACAMTVGLTAGRMLKVPFNSAFLISAGTSICGGSAIAAVCPVIHAGEDETAVSLSTVFILNSIALLVFPLIGFALGLTQTQFGLWAALAIHDTSSVVGAGMRYGPVALLVGTTVKLVRSLWIVPLVLASAYVLRSRVKVAWPWFILMFLGAASISALFPAAKPVWSAVSQMARMGFAGTLFLIGSGISRQSVKKVGWRPLAMGLCLWLTVSTVTLCCIAKGWISLQ